MNEKENLSMEVIDKTSDTTNPNIEETVEENNNSSPTLLQMFKKDIKELVIFGIFLICLMFVNKYIGSMPIVSGISMEPTLHESNLLVMSKLNYKTPSDVERYDIVVDKIPGDVLLIKRVIGLPGETVEVIDGYIYINGELLDEPFDFDLIEDAGLADTPITLNEDEFFLLGDNRNNSADSRYYGPQPFKHIRGKVICRLFSKFTKLTIE